MIGGDDSAVQIVGGLDPLDLLCAVAVGKNRLHVDAHCLRLPPFLRRVGTIEGRYGCLSLAPHRQMRIHVVNRFSLREGIGGDQA